MSSWEKVAETERELQTNELIDVGAKLGIYDVLGAKLVGTNEGTREGDIEGALLGTAKKDIFTYPSPTVSTE